MHFGLLEPMILIARRWQARDLRMHGKTAIYATSRKLNVLRHKSAVFNGAPMFLAAQRDRLRVFLAPSRFAVLSRSRPAQAGDRARAGVRHSTAVRRHGDDSRDRSIGTARLNRVI